MKTPIQRRIFLQSLAATACMTMVTVPVLAKSVDRELFGEPAHKVVYQLNRSDPEHIEQILFSVGELLRKYGDDIDLVVTVIGPGIHILAKRPGRPVPELVRQRVSSLAAYGVSFHACGNTMKSLNWTKEDILDFAEIVEIGADDLMRLQEQGYSYISW